MSNCMGSIVGDGAFQSVDAHVDAGEEKKGRQSICSLKIMFKYNRNIAKIVKL